VSQRQVTFGDLELNMYELGIAYDGSIVRIIKEYKNKLEQLTNENQQLMRDLAKMKVDQTKIKKK